MNSSTSSARWNLLSMLGAVVSSPISTALLVTAIFSARWLNCLPFSGFSPALSNVDTLGFYGRYLIFAQESFEFPFGSIRGLSFPFESAHISRGAIPLFALFFKAAGSVYPPLLEFNYLVFAELLAVFCTAYLTCRFLDLLQVRAHSARLLGACFVALSPALLFRSSNYYGETFVVMNFPLLLATAYFFVMQFARPNDWKYRLTFAAVFPVMALVDLYLLFAAAVLIAAAIFAVGLYSCVVRGDKTIARVRTVLLIVAAVGMLSMGILWLLGNQSNFEVPSRSVLFSDREGTGWGYGGGFGGGFHVADVFSVIAANPTLVPGTHQTPPRSFVDRLGIPVLNQRLQPGQYEGFAFIGSVPLLLLLLGLFAVVWRMCVENLATATPRSRFSERTSIWLGDPENRALAAVVFGSFCLYFLSWGYIAHVFGNRLNNLLTPSTILAFIYPNFMYARALGRLAIAFSMLTSIAALLIFYRCVAASWLSGKSPSRFLPAVSVALIALHLADVSDYLNQPEKVMQGNEIAQTFSAEDIATLKRHSASRVAVMLVPELLDSVHWNLVGFSIAYHTRIPISGATLGFGERRAEIAQYAIDNNLILDGDIANVMSRYGSVIVAAPRDYAEEIIARSNVGLESVQLKSQDVVLLVPKGRQP